MCTCGHFVIMIMINLRIQLGGSEDGDVHCGDDFDEYEYEYEYEYDNDDRNQPC